MRYLLAFNYFLFKPKTGWKNALCVGVCMVVPVVGLMIVLGYRAHVIEDLDDDPDKRYHRDFELNKLGDYLTRGVWPGLLQFGVQMLLAVVIYSVMIAVILSGMAANNPAALVILVVLGIVLTAFLAVAAAMLLWPVEIYAALRRDFEFGKAFSFARIFVAAMWRECLATILAFTVLSMVFGGIVMTVLGIIAGGVGLGLGYGVDPMVGMVVGFVLFYGGLFLLSFFMQATLTMANGHLLAQLYVVYVNKGGQPLRERDPFERDPSLLAEDLD